MTGETQFLHFFIKSSITFWYVHSSQTLWASSIIIISIFSNLSANFFNSAVWKVEK